MSKSLVQSLREAAETMKNSVGWDGKSLTFADKASIHLALTQAADHIEAADKPDMAVVPCSQVIPRADYVNAFYDLTKLLGIGARAKSPATVWSEEIAPKIERLISEGARAEKLDALALRAIELLDHSDRRIFGVDGECPAPSRKKMRLLMQELRNAARLPILPPGDKIEMTPGVAPSPTVDLLTRIATEMEQVARKFEGADYWKKPLEPIGQIARAVATIATIVAAPMTYVPATSDDMEG